MSQPVYQQSTEHGLLIVDKIGDSYYAVIGCGGRVERYNAMSASDISKKFSIPESVLQSGR